MEPDITDTESPIAQVTEGMRVIDADGEEVGVVDIVRLSDPDAVTVQAPVGAAGSLPDRLGTEDSDEPDVPADVAARLLRTGYLKVDGEEPFDVALYVAADQISDVSGDVVQLSVGSDELIAEE